MPPPIHLSQLLWIACSFTSREVYQYSTTTVHSILCSLPQLASNLLVFCSTPRSYYLLHMVLHYALALQPRGFSISVLIWVCINMLLRASPLEGPPKIILSYKNAQKLEPIVEKWLEVAVVLLQLSPFILQRQHNTYGLYSGMLWLSSHNYGCHPTTMVVPCTTGVFLNENQWISLPCLAGECRVLKSMLAMCL